jgi:glycerophosphoryl diester phosphodiesterase
MTEIASHRGGAMLWPENSRTAFENTARLPVDQVEFDVHPSSDGHLVVIHDATLDRTTNGTGRVCEKTIDELRRLTLNGTDGDRILLLDEVMEIFRPSRLKLRVEIKCGAGRVPYPGLPRRVAAAVRDARMLDRAVFTSFQIDSVREAVATARPPNHVWLVAPEVQIDIGLAGVAELALARGVPMLGIRCNMMNAAGNTTLLEAGLRVGGWAANDATEIARMLALGVDVFTTDRPDLALRERRNS